ncbi:expansin EXLX1 family cellulose-binding protein [Micromonospora sp. NPDC005686]|uniref:expansin EXLX1 family cellulose-binding protein n=1 Tax=Micromonospora sp. NPDC005686 TaxID=3364233 RepID=UPI0036C826FB
MAAAPPAGGATHSGKATFYDSEGAGGNCSRPGAPADRLYVALGPSEYASGASCGGFLDVAGPRGTVRVLVMDQCPECAPGHLDLSAEAFARIADPVQGVVKITYRAVVNPSLPGPLTFRMKEGSSQWWFAVLVGDHGNPLRSVEVRQNGSWRTAQRQDYNYWLIESGRSRSVRDPGHRRVRQPRDSHRHPDAPRPGAAQQDPDVRRQARSPHNRPEEAEPHTRHPHTRHPHPFPPQPFHPEPVRPHPGPHGPPRAGSRHPIHPLLLTHPPTHADLAFAAPAKGAFRSSCGPKLQDRPGRGGQAPGRGGAGAGAGGVGQWGGRRGSHMRISSRASVGDRRSAAGRRPTSR